MHDDRKRGGKTFFPTKCEAMIQSYHAFTRSKPSYFIRSSLTSNHIALKKKGVKTSCPAFTLREAHKGGRNTTNQGKEQTKDAKAFIRLVKCFLLFSSMAECMCVFLSILPPAETGEARRQGDPRNRPTK